MVILARLQFYHGKARRPREMSPLKQKRGVVYATYKTLYRAWLEEMRLLYPAECLTRKGPPVTFEQWSRGLPPDQPA